MVKRTTSGPTSSSRSRSVTKVPARLDMRTSSPLRITRTSWQSLTSSSPLPSVRAATPAFRRIEAALIDQPLPRQLLEDPINHAGINQCALRGIDLDVDAERREVLLD